MREVPRGCVLLTWAWQCPELQCLHPMEMTKPSWVRLKGLAKPSCGLCASDDRVCRKCPPQLSPSGYLWPGDCFPLEMLPLRLAKLPFDYAVCDYLAFLFIFNNPLPCSAVYDNPISLFNCNSMNVLLFWVTLVSPFERPDHPIPTFLCPRVCHFFSVLIPSQTLVRVLGPKSFKAKVDQTVFSFPCVIEQFAQQPAKKRNSGTNHMRFISLFSHSLLS